MDEYDFDGDPEFISEYDMFNIDRLDTDYEEISVLTGLEYAVNATEIHINNGKITDFSPLANLDKLRSINIANYNLEGVEDFSAFENLPALENFWLGTDNEFNLNILHDNRELRNVSVQASRLTNIQGLNDLQYLNNVHFSVQYING